MPVLYLKNTTLNKKLIRFTALTFAICVGMISCEQQSPTEEAIEDAGDTIEDVTDGPDSKLENAGEDLQDAAEELTE